MTQDEALSVLKTGANVFLTGEPGSGKTYTINQYVDHLRSYGVEPAITASTGIAATHIGGFTVHSWSGIGVRRELSAYDIDHIGQNKNVVRRVGNAHVLIIDEVSMLSARVLTMVDAVCREVRRNHEPFGGLQVVFVGDFFQLPPVSKRRNENEQATFVPETLHDEFAYRSSVWNALNLIVCYLSEQHRQEDPAFLEFLSSLRRESISEKHRVLLRTRYAPAPKDKTTQLYSHNADVDAINNEELGRLPGKERVFDMDSRGPENLVAALKRGCLSPEMLALKVGACVMFTKNDVRRHLYANGTLGTVAGFSKSEGHPVIHTRGGDTVFAEPDEWHIEDGGRVLARITQVPLRLAWAMTIHKSQGMSLDAAHMDLSQTFEYGQGYVALSRVKALAGLSLSGLNARALEVHPDVRAKDVEFRAQSSAAQEKFSSFDKKELAVLQENFIRACGGKKPQDLKTKENTVLETHNFPKRNTGHIRSSRLECTLALIRGGKTIAEAAKERGRTKDTVMKHLEMLKEKGVFPADTCMHLSDGREELFSDIAKVFVKMGDGRLKPVYEHFNGRVPYETIRLARLLHY